MSKRILITYATRAGSTIEVATAIKQSDFRDWNKIRGWAQTIFA